MRTEPKNDKQAKQPVPDRKAFSEAEEEQQAELAERSLEEVRHKEILIEKRRKTPEDDYPENEYFMKIASRFKWAKYLVAAAAVVFFLAMISIFRRDITLDNFRYLLRDMNTGGTKYTEEYGKISFDAVGDTEFALFRDYLVVVRPGDTLLYSFEGKAVLNLTNEFITPKILTSDSYFIVYDFGQTTQTYSVVNAFSKVYEGTTEAPIAGAAISPAGLYAFIQRTNDYRGSVEIHDRDFDVISRVYTDRYISSVCFNDEGDRLAVASFGDDNGEWYSEISVVDPYSDKSVFTASLHGVMLVSCAFDGESVIACGDTGIYTYDPDGTLRSSFLFDGGTPVTLLPGRNKYAVAFNTTVLGNEKEIICTGKGTELFRAKVPGKISAHAFSDSYTWIFTDDILYRFSTDGKDDASFSFDNGCSAVLPISDDRVLLCFPNYAQVFRFDGTGEAETGT